MLGTGDRSSKFGRALEIMHRKQNSRWHCVLTNGLIRQLALSLHFHVAPRTAGTPRFHQPKQFRLNVAFEFAARHFSAAGRQKCRGAKSLLCQPTKQLPPLRIALQPIQPQLNCAGFLQTSLDLARHFPGRFGGGHGADTVFTGPKRARVRSGWQHFIENMRCSMR